MSRHLSALLGTPATLFTSDLKRLEKASGETSADVRLHAEIVAQAQLKIRELGLDPADTTPKELYHALIGLIGRHDEFLAGRIGSDDPADVAALLPKIRQTALQLTQPKTAWVLKPAVAKRLLKAQPPKALQKSLGYKSLDSMLKREPVAELFAGLEMVQSAAWLKKFRAAYAELTHMDFETRPIEIRQLEGTKWQAAAKQYVARRRHILLTVRELGTVVVLPVPLKRLPGLTITLLPQLLYHLNEIRLYSSFYKSHQMQPGLGATIAASLAADEGNHVRLAGHKVHWRVVQRHFGQSGRYPEALEPHVQPEDISWRKTEELLFKLEPALHFWHALDFVAVRTSGEPVSLNLMDNALNYLNKLPYGRRTYQHFRDGLWNELYARYMALPVLESHVIQQLDRDETHPLVLAMRGGA